MTSKQLLLLRHKEIFGMKQFNSKEEAINDMYRCLEAPGEDCIDNTRFAYLDNPEEMEDYENSQEEGCCGFFDMEILVAGRKATIGCNYGH